jgi:hypothetical protein
MAHTVIKPERIVATAAELLEQKLVVPALFQREGIDQFKGSAGDAYSVVVPGVLPYRRYGWRNDRSAPIQFDEYSERKVTVTFGDNVYSAVKLTDEQKDFDFGGSFGRLVNAQTDAIRRGLEHEAVDALTGAPYEVTIAAGANAGIRNVAIQARAALNKLNVPDGERVLLIGTAFEEKALLDDALALAQNSGERRSLAALERAAIGELYGLTIVVSQEIAPHSAYAFVRSAFVFLNGVPTVPQSVPFGAAATAESSLGGRGIGLRWLQDYDTLYFQDRSVFNTYPGFRYVDDPMVSVDENKNGVVSTDNHFVRAVKITLATSGTATTVTTTTNNEELSEITGITLAGS